MKAGPLISIIVPVWNGRAVIGDLLEALLQQDAHPASFEVIVVDNGSTDGTIAKCMTYPEIKLLHEPQPGSYCARNCGVSAARGEWLLFTDADCRPARSWVGQALALARAGAEKTIYAGRIDLFFESSAGRPAAEFEALVAFNQAANVEQGYCVTANWLCAKSSLAELGGFRPDLLSGGDVELSRRACAAGWRVRYAPELMVAHPARATLSDLVAKRRRVLGGLWAMKRGQRLRSVRLLRRVAGDVIGQAAKVWHSDMPARAKPGVGLIAICLAAAGLVETIRLTLGGSPYRS